MCASRSGSRDDGKAAEKPHSLPATAEHGRPARATEQAALARIGQFVRQAGSLGLRVQRTTIAPAPVPHRGRTPNEPGPTLIFSDESSVGPCIVSVEQPTASTGSSSGRPFNEPVMPPSDSEAETQVPRRAGGEENGHRGRLVDGAGRGTGGAAATVAGPRMAAASSAGDGKGGLSGAAGTSSSD
ncbi:hypothetical protein BU14_0482s0011 [Porphyra umbilicalis]|uniref:Uncharacterized protein n=1 Tax=Porphyra umbilicalis TaxID=2786 RepID=A0A1X6NTW8_PORUM|nr:hypothetical protein BU14_0482s0011 [Porphyra umbilicalis]|eukprot:OSX72017.1 hypothetical protein BU14_0482s0011 [Porphyra umbilicalis]